MKNALGQKQNDPALKSPDHYDGQHHQLRAEEFRKNEPSSVVMKM